MSDIRLIIMDLDGTLLNDRGEVSEENRKALLDAQKQGVTTAVCSGRYCENASLVFLENGLSGPIVGSNGAQMMDRPMGVMQWKHFMAPEAAQRVRETLDEAKAEYFLFADELVVTSNPAARHHSELSMGKKITSLSKVRFGHGREAVDEALQRGIYKFYVCDNGKLPDIRKQLHEIPNTNVTSSEPWNLEVMASGVNKGEGLARLAAWLGISDDQVLAFGDQENDLPMLSAAGMGVAMGNAEESVLRQARYSTLTNEENGVAAFIRRVIG